MEPSDMPKDQEDDAASAFRKAAGEAVPTLDEVRERFAADRFATERLGAVVDEAACGHAVVSCDIVPGLRNGMGAVMGGAIYTLADFASAVASNTGQPPTVTVSSTIEHLATAKGSRLIATCDADRSGHRLGFYTARVTDDLGTLVAIVTSCSMRV